MDYEKTVRDILRDLLEDPECADMDAETDLEPFGMDSLNSINLVIALEDQFEIEIPEDLLGIQFVRNIDDICRLVEQVREA